MFSVRLFFATASVFFITDTAQAGDAVYYIGQTIHNNHETVNNLQKYKPFGQQFRDEIITKLSKMNTILEAAKHQKENRLGNLKEPLELAFSIWFIGWDCWRDENCGFAGIYFRKAMLNLGAALMKELPDDDQKTGIRQRHPRVFKDGGVDFAVQESLLYDMLLDTYNILF